MGRIGSGSPEPVTDEMRELDPFLEDAFDAQERLSSADLQRRAITSDLTASALTKIDALPEGEYAQDEAAEAVRALQA